VVLLVVWFGGVLEQHKGLGDAFQRDRFGVTYARVQQIPKLWARGLGGFAVLVALRYGALRNL
jgi:hypothetical protein